MAQHRINVDLAQVYSEKKGGKLITTLAWGDPVDLVKQGRDHVQVKVAITEDDEGTSIPTEVHAGFIRASKHVKATDVTIARKDSRVAGSR